MEDQFSLLFIFPVVFLSMQVLSQECPYYMDIKPCLCTHSETIPQTLDMDCSLVVDIDQLQQIFRANFPYTTYRDFIMIGTDDHPINIGYLPDGVFGPVTFQRVNIRHTGLQGVGNYVFLDSNDTLEELRLNFNQLATFPTNIVAYLPKLHFLDLSHNHLTTIADIHSSFLQTLYLQYNIGLSLTPEAFSSAPRIVELNLGHCGLESLSTNMFLQQINLTSLRLESNQLSQLDTATLAFPGDSLSEIVLSGNVIQTVNEGFISGTGGDTYLELLNNLLKDLLEEVWRPLFETMVGENGKGLIMLDGNPLDCGCNLGWLVTSSDFLSHVAIGAKCENGTNIHDLNPDYYTLTCQ